MSYHQDLDALRKEVESFIDGDDIRVVEARPGPSGREDFVRLACGETEGFVFRLHERMGCSIGQQMKRVLPALRAREVKRIADKAADDASFVWLYEGQVGDSLLARLPEGNVFKLPVEATRRLMSSETDRVLQRSSLL